MCSTPDSAVSAIVINHNGGEALGRCIEHLQGLGEQLQQIIVVDNNSTDGSLDTLYNTAGLLPTGKLVIEASKENLGPAAARNVGMRIATTTWVLLIDDDVFLESGSFKLLKDCADSTLAAVTVPRLVIVPEYLIQADGADVHFVGSMRLRNGRSPLEGTLVQRRFIATFSSSCLLAKRDALLSVGGFDESFFIYQEDMELGLRLRSFGYQLVCEPHAVALHERGRGTPALSFRDSGLYPRTRAFFTHRNRWRMILLHYRFRTMLILAPAIFVFELASIVFLVLKGLLSVWFESWRWQWSSRKLICHRRRWIQSQRVLGDAQLLSGGSLPLAPGLVNGGFASCALKVTSRVLDSYWRVVCRLL